MKRNRLLLFIALLLFACSKEEIAPSVSDTAIKDAQFLKSEDFNWDQDIEDNDFKSFWNSVIKKELNLEEKLPQSKFGSKYYNCSYPLDLLGLWRGSATQVGASTWDIWLFIGCRKIYVYYPTLGCYGYWNFMSSDDTTYNFQEIILRGDRCISPCGVSISKHKVGTLKFDLIPEECSGAVATGYLTKR